MDARQPHAALRPLLALAGQRHQAVRQDTEQAEHGCQQSRRYRAVEFGEAPVSDPGLRRALSKRAPLQVRNQCGEGSRALHDAQRSGSIEANARI